MSAPRNVDRMLEAWLESEAAGPGPDRLFDEIIGSTSGTRQARAWPSWLDGLAALADGHRPLLVALLLLLVAAIGSVALAGGAFNALLPSPSRPAVTPRSVAGTTFAATCAHPHSIIVAGGGVWVACLEQSRRFDASTGHLTGAVEAPIVVADAAGAYAATAGAVELVDPQTGAPRQTTPVAGAVAMALDEGAAWVAQGDSRTVTRIDRATLTAGRPVLLPSRPGTLVAGAGSVWVTLPDRDLVVGIDQMTGATTRSFDVADPQQVAFAAGRLWVLDSAGTTLTSIDPGQGDVVSRPFVPVAAASNAAPGVPVAGFAVIGTTVWEVGGSQLVATDARTGVVQQLRRVDPPTVALVAIASAGGSLIAIDSDGTRLLRINP
jgi:hypothetical protein